MAEDGVSEPANLYARDQASQAFGMALEMVETGSARLVMTVRADMLNGHGICHGGLVFTLADTAFAYACNSHGPSVATQCTINFLAPAQLGDRLTAEAVEMVLEGATGIYDVTIRNQANEMLAMFRGVSRRLKPGVSLQKASSGA